MRHTSIHVRVVWDAEAQVWVASTDDVAGLATEAETIEELTCKVLTMLPELIAENGLGDLDTPGADIPVHIMSEQLGLS
jgi:hypothetical protein